MAGLWNDVCKVSSWVGGHIGFPSRVEVEKVIIKEVGMKIPGRGFLRIAGFSGATAIAMGAYGAHAFKESDAAEKLKVTYDTGYKMHLVHSVALLAIPLTRRPYLVGSLMTTGLFLFSGSCYYHALTGKTGVRWVTPYGGMMLIFAWLAMML